MDPIPTLLLGLAAALVLKRLLTSLYTRLSRRYPPGPKGYPIIGNVLDMPPVEPWLELTEWTKKYGDAIYLEILGKPMLILNSYDAVVDLLERRSSIYSDRPRFPMLCDVMRWDWLLTFIPYGDRFRKHRWHLHKHLNAQSLERYKPIQSKSCRGLLLDLLRSPNDYFNHLRKSAGSTIMMIAYGHEVKSAHDQFITLAEDAISGLSEAGLPGTYAVDHLPWLRHIPSWFPGAGFKRQGAKWAASSLAMLNTPFELTKERIKNGTAVPSMMSSLMQSCTNEDGVVVDEDIIAGTAAVAYTGGADTTVSSTSSFILAAVLDHEIVRKAHEELDRVVGNDRLPTFEDRASLPYIEGIVREAMRWRPVLPLCPMHRLMVDDEYKGYHIPAGCEVIANHWALLHDEKEYPNPEKFLPERWIQKEGEPYPRHPFQGAFGFGRRKCPGRQLADNSIFIAVSQILAVFDIQKAVDEDGQVITPSGAYNSGLVTYPSPFKCRITPRHDKVEELILKAKADYDDVQRTVEKAQEDIVDAVMIPGDF